MQMYQILLTGEIVGLIPANSAVEAVRLYRAQNYMPGFYTARLSSETYVDDWSNAA